MKVAANKAIETVQAVGAGAAAVIAGAFGPANSGAFATLLNSFTSSDAKQAVEPTGSNAATKNAESAAAAQPKAAASKAVKGSKAHAANADTNDAGHECCATHEADADDTTGAATQTAPAEQTSAAAPAEQQPVKMEEIIKSLNLNEQQVAQLAQALNVSVDDLKKMQIAVSQAAKDGAAQIALLAPNGQKHDLAKLLFPNAPQQGAGASQVMDKIAQILNLDETQKKEFFAQLNIGAMQVTGAPAGQAQAAPQNAEAAQKIDTLQPVAKNAPSVADMSKIAAQETAQPQTQNEGGQGGNSFNAQAGAAMAGTAQEGDAATEAQVEGDFSTALNKAGETAGAATAKTGKTEAMQAAAQPQAAESAKPHAKVMSQIVEKASILQLPHNTQAKISLNPKELGAVDIKLVMHDASVKASIVVENHAVKQAVEQNLDQLKASLQQQGIAVDEMQVSVDQQNGGNSRNSNQAQWEAARGTSLGDTAPRAAEEPARPVFARRAAGNHRVSVTA